MYLAITLISIIAAWRWGDWKNWTKYHPTMLFISLGSVLYNFLYANHLLWHFNDSRFTNHAMSELLLGLIVFPCTALLFLSNYPANASAIKKIAYISIYIGVYAGLEKVGSMFGVIKYFYGWSFWWSVLWDMVMFPILLLHHKKPVAAYFLSLIVLIFTLVYFPNNFILHSDY